MQIFIPVIIVSLIGLISGLVLAFASKFMSVPTNQKVQNIRDCLPGANCGGCGYSGCDDYAAALAEGKVSADKCSPGGEATISALSGVLGIEIDLKPKVAFIVCGGNAQGIKDRFDYAGLKSCKGANLVYGGPHICKNGCLQFGDCIKACPFNAISIVDGKVSVCEELCKGCGVCVDTCPKALISLVPKGSKARVACSNTAPRTTRVKGCASACVGCKLCEKACEAGALTVVNDTPVINYELCTSCEKCKTACKRGVIV